MAYEPPGMPKTRKPDEVSTITPVEKSFPGSIKKNETQGSKKAE